MRIILLMLLLGTIGCSQQTTTPTPEPKPQAGTRVRPTPPATPAPVTRAAPPQPQARSGSTPKPTPPPTPASATSNAQAAEVAAPETSDEEAPDRKRLPPYLKVLRQRSLAEPALPDVTLEGNRTVRIVSNDATQLRITRTGMPLRPNGSIVLRIDHQVFEWTRQHGTLDLSFSPASGWAITARDGQPK